MKVNFQSGICVVACAGLLVCSRVLFRTASALWGLLSSFDQFIHRQCAARFDVDISLKRGSGFHIPSGHLSQNAWTSSKRNKCRGIEPLPQQDSGSPCSRLHSQTEESYQQRHTQRWQDHGIGRDRWHVALLYRRLTRPQSRPGTSAGDESALHRFRFHAAHLGEVHPLLNPT